MLEIEFYRKGESVPFHVFTTVDCHMESFLKECFGEPLEFVGPDGSVTYRWKDSEGNLRVIASVVFLDED